ncbi:MAG: aspartate ammonia-lyase [Clostridia bacterium]|nr:aspartate ammonia-lyase [Clostridia bacterium]
MVERNGKVVPADAYYGINGVRFQETFAISGYKIHREFIIAMAMVKKAAALANMKAGVLEKSKAMAIAQAADEVIEGKWHDHFVGEAIQGGAGTGINMVTNEVLANRAIEILGHKPGEYEHVSPVDHVNKGQSTNDALPTGIRIAMIRMLQGYIKANELLVNTIKEKAAEYKDCLKLGRTHLQDAVPMRVGDELAAWAEAFQRDVERGKLACKLLAEVNMGATAIGTGLNADPRYRELVIEELRAASGISDLKLAKNLIDATQNLDVLVEVSGLLRAGAVSLIKVANDLRLMASGPMAGLAELELPAMAAGSSIMAGKVNPIVPEVVNQVAFKVLGNDLTIMMVAQAGQFELNVMEPVLAFAFFESISMLTAAINTLAEKTIKGMKYRTDRCQQYAESAMSLVTSLVPLIGYNKAAEVSKKAVATGKSIIEVVLEEKLLPEEQARELLDPRHMVG